MKSTNYSDDYEVPVLTPGQSFILGYTDEVDGIYPASKDNPIILFDDFTGSFKWVDFPFKVKSSALKILTLKSKLTTLRYIFHVMGVIGFSSNEHNRLWISQYSLIKIPLPPIEIQSKVVHILDCFTELTAELTAELNARKKQYQIYIDKLIWGDDEYPDLISLSQIGEIFRGKRFVHADAVNDGVPCIHYGELYTYYGSQASITKSFIREELRPKMRYAKYGDVVVVGAGENKEDIGIGLAWLGSDNPAVHDACYVFRSDFDPRYVSFYLRSSRYHNELKKYISEGKICSFSGEDLGKMLIPNRPLNEQKRIADILEIFERLLIDMNIGIPAEISARQKQYEYYRDKLLSFEELKA